MSAATDALYSLKIHRMNNSLCNAIKYCSNKTAFNRNVKNAILKTLDTL